MNNSIKYFAFSMLLAAMASCTESDIIQTVGSLPDETPMNNVGSRLYSTKTFSNMITILMYEDDEPATDEIGYTLTKPATANVTVKATASPELVAAYNTDHNTELKEFPAANVTFEGDGSLTIPAGKKTAENIRVTFSPEGLEAGTIYLLAVTLTQNPAGVEAAAGKQTIYYRIGYREKITTCDSSYGPMEIPPLFPDMTSVFYVNTEFYQPSIVAGWGLCRMDMLTTFEAVLYSIGNIVNLKRATIDYDASSQRVLLQLGSDLSYVLEHRDKYVRHLQEYERKVCLCIENGGKGIGFCNMNETQIADFARQVKDVVVRYQLDGVNLWDEDSKYAKTGTPAMNTTSYPRLIKALREALPAGKLLTLVDKGDATEYFYDVNKCGGIEVGRYIDYAWHGYFSPTLELQIINPNSDGSAQEYSQYTRRAIAGLDDAYYGSVNIPRFPNTGDYGPKLRAAAPITIAKWRTAGNKKNNILVFGDDLIGQEYGDREGAVLAMLSEAGFMTFMEDGNGWDDSIDDFSFGEAIYYGECLDARLNMGADNNPYKKDW